MYAKESLSLGWIWVTTNQFAAWFRECVWYATLGPVSESQWPWLSPRLPLRASPCLLSKGGGGVTDHIVLDVLVLGGSEPKSSYGAKWGPDLLGGSLHKVYDCLTTMLRTRN